MLIQFRQNLGKELKQNLTNIHHLFTNIIGNS
jgi:hypothetical protein